MWLAVRRTRLDGTVELLGQLKRKLPLVRTQMFLEGCAVADSGGKLDPQVPCAVRTTGT
jgi:hypothetical protein